MARYLLFIGTGASTNTNPTLKGRLFMSMVEESRQAESEQDAFREKEAVQGLAEKIVKELSLDLVTASDGMSFKSRPSSLPVSRGVRAASGQLRREPFISVQLELAEFQGGGNFGMLLKRFAGRTIVIQEKDDGKVSFLAEMKVKATPMSYVRENALLEELKNIDALSKTLQEELTPVRSFQDLEKLYEPFPGIMKPVLPWSNDEFLPGPEILVLADEVGNLLAGAVTVALAGASPLAIDHFLAVLANMFFKNGKSLGRVIAPSLSSKLSLELAGKCPGVPVIPAINLSLGSNPYELGHEIKAFLDALSAAQTPALFIGSMSQLQNVFHGGQGAENDPLSPVVLQIPESPLGELCRYAVHVAGRKAGGMPAKIERDLACQILESLQGMSPAVQCRILPAVAHRCVAFWGQGNHGAKLSLREFSTVVSGKSETLGGLPARPRAGRSPEVQKNIIEVVTTPLLLAHLKENLVGQDNALEELDDRLKTEALTRNIHQPIRYAAVGTPGTGKSQSAALLAEKLGIPYVLVDAASMPDFYTASAQMFGSGRGIVMSHQPGRLEQAAKQYTGVVLEIADLDHSPPHVRAPLADSLLQLLETGEAQSATGAVFNCCNIIFVFTMNLPGGMDESIRKGIGFNNLPSRQDIYKGFVSEIKNMLSGAFLSRLGSPIIFDPLREESLGVIVERAVIRALLSAFERVSTPVSDIKLEKNLGNKVLDSLRNSVTSFGARALLEHGRSLAARAFMELRQTNAPVENKTLEVSYHENNVIVRPLE